MTVPATGAPVPHRIGIFAAVARFLYNSTRGYRLRPWASPYLRWRIETYWGMPADQINAARFFEFSWLQRRRLWRFLRWAGRMESQQHYGFHS